MLSSTESLSFALQLYQPSSSYEEAHTSLLTSLYTPSIKDERMQDSVQEFYRSTSEMNLKIFEEDARISSLVVPDSWLFESLPYVSTLELKINHEYSNLNRIGALRLRVTCIESPRCCEAHGTTASPPN